MNDEVGVREFFAGIAMLGMMINGEAEGESPKAIAKEAYLMADVMMKERTDA